MDAFLQDLRYAWRWLRKTPGFTALAVLCIGVGIGVNTTIFSCVYGVFFRPFGFDHPERIVEIDDHYVKGPHDNRYDLSYPNYLDWKREATSYSQMAGYSGMSMTLTDGEEPERFQGMAVDHELFPMLGVQPLLGRQFRADEDIAGAPGVVLISHDLWTTRYRSDPNILSRTIVVNDQPCTVVGVMPPRFAFWNHHQLWTPLAPTFATRARNDRVVGLLARLKPGVAVAQARNEAKVFTATLAKQYPNDNQGWTATLRPFSEALVPNDVRLIVITMMGAVMFVLLIACSNVANLLLSRATTRAREIAIRSAIGAGRSRIVRQLLTESVLIALMGGALGVLLAFWGCDLLWAAMPGEQRPPYYITWGVDGPTLIYTFAISLLTGVLFGLAPAFETVRVNLQESLKEGSRGTGAGARRGRMRSSLVVAQVALSLVLLVGAALFVRTFLVMQHVNPGFDTHPMLTMRFYLPGERYDKDRVRLQRVEDVVRRVESLPGVVAATASNTILLENGGWFDGIKVEGRTVLPGEEPQVFFTGVTAHWLKTYGIPITRGRDFTDAEASDSSGVAIITQAFANKIWPGQDPLGRRFSFVADSMHQWVHVIGVVPNHRIGDLDEKEPVTAAYVPSMYVSPRSYALIVRTEHNPTSFTNAIRREIHASDPGMPIYAVKSMDEVKRFSFWDKAFFGKVFSVFGLIALVLAIVGVYGVIAYSVSQRTHEIGVRMALGADEGTVLRLVVGDGLRLALWGVGIGILGALGVTWVIRSELFGVSPTDPVSFAGIATLLTGVACLASWIPAQRAARVQPTVALREE
jgi:putative ABC transport system permease protein